jgi:hypothetical protein
MNNTNTGGPAFPNASIKTKEGIDVWGEGGMTLRDYFAAKAMPSVYTDYCESANVIGFEENWRDGVALDAYAMADAMLKARGA